MRFTPRRAKDAFSRLPCVSSYFNLRKQTCQRILRCHYADIYLNPGRYEGFCLSLVEAMSQGLVPVTFPIGVAPEIIRNGKNGYIIQSMKEMEGRISYLVSRPHLRGKMAEEAIKTAASFHPRKIVEQYTAVYRRFEWTKLKRELGL